MAREINKLTDRQVAKLLEPGRHHDGLGLCLQVTSPTSRSWLLRYERNGKEKWMGLGPAHTVTLAKARERAQDARLLLLDGIDPIESRRAKRDLERKQESEIINFKAAARKFLDLHELTWRNAKHRAQWRSTLEAHAYRTLGPRPVKAIDSALVNAALAPIWTRTPETARRVQQRIERILQWVKDGMPLPHSSAARRVVHHKALPYADIPAFMAELRQRDSVSARALEFTILCAARTGETIGARWPEIDHKAKIWIIPAERMKAHKEHTVPLVARALDILDGLPYEKGNDHVFIGGRKGAGLSNMAMLELLRGTRPDSDLTVHGFRSTFKDWCSEMTNFPDIVSEHALAHTIKSKVERAYRRGDLLAKRVKVMEAWSRYCCSAPVSAGNNVVTIRKQS